MCGGVGGGGEFTCNRESCIVLLPGTGELINCQPLRGWQETVPIVMPFYLIPDQL